MTRGGLWRVGHIICLESWDHRGLIAVKCTPREFSAVHVPFAGSGTKSIPLLEFTLIRSTRVTEFGARIEMLGSNFTPLAGSYTSTDTPNFSVRLKRIPTIISISSLDLLRLHCPLLGGKKRKAKRRLEIFRSTIMYYFSGTIGLHSTPPSSRADSSCFHSPFSLILATTGDATQHWSLLFLPL